MRRTLLLKWRNLVCVAMMAILPSSLVADDTGRAMLHTRSGKVSINGNMVPSSQALFPNDTVQTQKDSLATIDAPGSTVTVDQETVVQFQDDELNLDHGYLSVSTVNGMKVHIDCVTVIPVNLEQTQYTVMDVDGKVKVSALKDDVYIESRSSNPKQMKKGERSDREVVHEGEQKTREEKCVGGLVRPVEATKAAFSTFQARILGLAAVGVIACLGICHDDDPISPSKP